MSDELSFAELDGQHVELLPARTVLSTFSTQGTDGGTGGHGSDCTGTVGVVMLGRDLLGNGGGNCVGTPGASADGTSGK